MKNNPLPVFILLFSTACNLSGFGEVTNTDFDRYVSGVLARPEASSFFCKPEEFHSTNRTGIVQEAEKRGRMVIPYASNQVADLVSDPMGQFKVASLEVFMGQFYFDGESYKNFTSMDYAIFSWYFQNGVCNDYQDVTGLILSSMIQGLPIYKVITQSPIVHNFSLLGDYRQKDCYVVDSWMLNREPVLWSESLFNNYTSRLNLMYDSSENRPLLKLEMEEAIKIFKKIPINDFFSSEKNRKVIMGHYFSQYYPKVRNDLQKYSQGVRGSENFHFDDFFTHKKQGYKKRGLFII